MELTWEIAVAVFTIAAGAGGAAFRWISGGIAAEATAREKMGDGLSQKIDHKFNNAGAQFQAVNHRLDSNCEKTDALTRETVRLSEALRLQEMQTREIKLEFKESMAELKSDMGLRFSGMDKRFDTLERYLRPRDDD